MSGTVFHESISGRVVIPAPHASNGGTNNFYINSGSDQPQPHEPFSTVPILPDNDFIERPEISAWLRGKCNRPGSRTALVGLGGVGKSQLAIRYAHEVRQQSPNTYVFWVHASSQARFEEAYREIADRLQLPGRADPKTNVLKLVYNWLFSEQGKEWLLILDNADDIDVFYPKTNNRSTAVISAQHHLAAYLPQSRNGRILITSRSRDAAGRLIGNNSIFAVLPMNGDQAEQLLRKKLGDVYDPAVATDLVSALECMPLAITQAAAYILRRAPLMSPSKYLDEFSKSDKKKARLLKHESYGNIGRDITAANSVVTTWQITFDQIRQERRSAADLLSFMSFFNPQGIPGWVLLNYQRSNKEKTSDDGGDPDDSDDDEFNDDIEILRGYSLVAVTTQEDMWEMHALVQFCTRIWLSSFDNIDGWRRTFLQIMSREYPSGEYENWIKCRQLNPHIEPIIEVESQGEEDAPWTQLLTNVGWYEWQIGRYRVAESVLRKALMIRERLFGISNTDTIFTVDILASALGDQGKYEEAEQMHRRALSGSEKALGIDHPDTLTSVNNLALVLRDQGKYEEAEQMNRQALSGCEKALGIDHPDTLMSVNNLALVLRDQGKYEEAEQMNRRALSGSEKALGVDHPDTLTSVNNLAGVLQGQGKYEEAEQMYRRALSGSEKALGIDHPDTLMSVNNLAVVLRDQGKYEEAERMNRRALSGREKALGIDHPDTLMSVSTLAGVLRDQGKYEEAEQMHRRALSGREKALGIDHPGTLTSVYNLAFLLQQQIQLELADELYSRACVGYIKVLGPSHPTTLACQHHHNLLKEEMALYR